MKEIHVKIHDLEVSLAKAINDNCDKKVCLPLEHAYDVLVHGVAEWVRTAEARLIHT